MIKPMFLLTLTALLTGCLSPDHVRAAPEDTWTWQVSRNYQQFAHCLTDALNSAPVHSWFYEAPRPITSFDQQWQRRRIILKSVDPLACRAERGKRTPILPPADPMRDQNRQQNAL